MNMKNQTFRLALLVAGLAPAVGLAQSIGQPAPPLVVKEWIKGGPVEVKAGTNIFVVEIFATTGAASRASITNLNEVQRRFKGQGVVVVGVSDEPVGKIRRFVSGEGAAIEYPVGADNGRQTSLGYMMPARQRGVPHVFVVGKDGKLLWHGHPLHGLNRAVEAVVAGRYNADQASKAELAQTQIEQYLALARRQDPRTDETGRRVLAARTNDVVQLCDLAFQIATDPKIAQREAPLANLALDRAQQLAPTNNTKVTVTRAVLLFETGHRDEGLARVKEAIASAQGAKDKAHAEASLRAMEARLSAATTNEPPQSSLARDQIGLYVGLARRGDPRAGEAGRHLLGTLTNDATALCDLAFAIATDPKIKKRDFQLANQALEEAERLGQNSTRATISRSILLYQDGQREQAVALARQAVAAGPKGKDKAQAEAWLRKIESLGEPAHTNNTKLKTMDSVMPAPTNAPSRVAPQPNG
jgi:hypothetical protein